MISSRTPKPSCSFFPLVTVAAVPLLGVLACGPKNTPPSQPPAPVAATPDAEPEGEPKAEPGSEAEGEPKSEPKAEPKAPAAKVPEGSFAIGTFNLEWAFDAISEKRPKKAQPNVPAEDEVWEWKRDRIVEILVAERLDVVILTELGGERELSDITSSITVKGGYDYRYAWIDAPDRFTGQHVAILSRFPVSGERHDEELKVPLHVAAEVELPGGQEITVVAVHLKEGKNKGAVEQRQRQARAIRRMIRRDLRKRPVVVAGTLGSKILPTDDDYEGSAPQTIAGKKGCTDSATHTLAQLTTVQDGEAMDRIIVCKMEMKGAEVAAEDKIVRGPKDESKAPWPSVPVDEGSQRDVSDHLLLWSEVVIPKHVEETDEDDEDVED